MRILEMTIRDYKGIEASLDFRSPVVVLFGANDSGKTNILEAIESALRNGLGAGFVDAGLSRQAGDAFFTAAALVELDGLFVPGHPDRALLAELLQFAPDTLSYTPRLSERPGANSRKGPRPARYEIDGHVEFDLGTEERPLTELLSRLRLELLHAASESALRWEAVGADYELLLDACLGSNVLWWDGRVGGVWLTALDEAEWDDGLKAAARRLSSDRGAWREWPPPLLKEFILALMGEYPERPVIFLDVGGDSTHAPLWDVVRIADTALTLRDAIRGIQAYLEWRCHRFVFRGERVVGYAREPIRWLEPFDGDDRSVAFRYPAKLLMACQELSDRATKVAPSFVSEKYTLSVVPREPDDWTDEDDGPGLRTDVLAIAPNGRLFPLGQVGSGLAVWAAISLTEAARQLREEFVTGRGPTPGRDHLDPSTSEDAGAGDSVGRGEAEEYEEPLPDDGESAATYEPSLVFILDEPERHLHPVAQREAASWIATLVGESPNAKVVIATHSPAFLDIPTTEAEYYGVARTDDGATALVRLTEDAATGLDEAAELFGVTRGDVLQIYRQFLVVEGTHDELVLRRFFAEQLSRARAFLLPLHGLAHLSVAAVEFLARAGRPVTLLCDNVRNAAIVGAEIPPGLLLTPEETQLRKVLMPLHGLTNEGPVRAVAFDEPDVLTALPERAVDSLLRRLVGTSFEGWDAFKRAWTKEAASQNVKAFFVERYGLGEHVAPASIVPSVLEAASPEDRPMPSLTAALEEALTSFG